MSREAPLENGYIESFNGRFRDELLNGKIFTTLLDATARQEREYGPSRESRFRAIRAPKIKDWPVGERLVTSSPVCSYNEWDPLEEVIVGRLEGAMIPSKHLTVTFNIPRRLTRIYKLIAGLPYPKFFVRPAQRELDEFIHILEAGEPIPFGGSFHCAALDVRRRGELQVVLLSADFSGEPPQRSNLGRILGSPPQFSSAARDVLMRLC